MFKRLAILIFVIGIIFLIIGSWLTGWNNIRAEGIDLKEKAIASREDYWSNSMITFRYSVAKIRTRDLEIENEELLTQLLIEKLSREYSEKLIVVLADYIKFMQSLAEANNLEYPAFILEDYQQ